VSPGPATRLRRLVLTVACVLALGVAGLVVRSSLDSGSTAAALQLRGTWRELPAPPLSPRAGALAVWTGREAVFLGGETRTCPPCITCDIPLSVGEETRRYGEMHDGAAYNLASGTWRRLAPVPTRVGLRSAWYAGGRVLVFDDRGRWWSYDVTADSWTAFRPRWDDRSGVSAAGSRIYGLSSYDRPGGHVVAYDPATASWSRYPVDRLRPRLDGYPLATSRGPVLVGSYASRTPYHHLPSTMVVDVWSGRAWQRLPLTPQLDRAPVWTGHRLVDPVQGTRYHGGPDAWPHRYPEGGVLDPTTGRWSALPAAWQAAEVRYGTPAPGWDVDTSDGAEEPRLVVDGAVYDDETRSAWLLPRPSDAPEYFASGVWAGRRLVVFGGADFNGQHQTGVSGRAWIYTP
jgi:hypothetical protein